MRKTETSKPRRTPAENTAGRTDRLAQALRANLLKRKAQARARSSPKRREEGGQDPS